MSYSSCDPESNIFMCVPLIFADGAESFEHSPQTAQHTVDLDQGDQECMSTFSVDGRLQI